MEDTHKLVTHLINDIGGASVKEPVNITEHPLLPWEKRCHALLDVLDYHKIVNTEEKRRGTEEIGAEMGEKLTYYQKWIVSCANCLLQKRILTPEEIGTKTKEIALRYGVTL